MAKTTSKKNSKTGLNSTFSKDVRSAQHEVSAPPPAAAGGDAVREKVKFRQRLEAFRTTRRVHLHKSFHRSFREDYHRDFKTPGIFAQLVASLKLIFKNFRIFFPLMLLAIVLNCAFIGLMSQSTYQNFSDTLDQTTSDLSTGDIGAIPRAGLLLISTVTSGGLSGESNEASIFFAVLIFLLMWLSTIFALRQYYAHRHVTFRDTLYNSSGPLMATLVVFLVGLIDCIPIFLFIIALSAAVQTEFLATPFYALVFFIFACIMILTSVYLLARTLIALVAVSAPGLYPIKALRASSDLIAGRRTHFVIRLIAFILFLAVLWVVIMLPLILFDMGMKNFSWTENIPFVPICLLIMTCFSAIFLTTYLYVYYRYLLANEE